MALTFGVVDIVSGLAPSYAAYAAILPVMGLVTLLTLTAANASIQLGVDPLRRGRVMALYIMVLMGGTAIGSPILGGVAESAGPRWALIGGGAATVVGVLASVAVLRVRSLRRARQRASDSDRCSRPGASFRLIVRERAPP